MNNLIAQGLRDPFGTVEKPDALQNFDDVQSGGIGQILSVFTSSLIVLAGVYALFNFIFAGYAFMSAGDDPGKIQGAWAKIYQTIIGLVVAAGAFVLAAVVGQLIFGDWNALTNPIIPRPS